MNWKEKTPEEILDKAIEEVRNDSPDTSVVQEAGDRVRGRLFAESAQPAHTGVRLESCADFQSLIPAYLQEELPGARLMLFEEHLRECVPCRKALRSARHEERPRAWATGTSAGWSAWYKWGAVAATLLVAVGLVYWGGLDNLIPFGGSQQLGLHAVEGEIYRISDTGMVALNAGESVAEGDLIRTAKGARAELRLPDGSTVEVGERAELAVSSGWSDTTIQLRRGNIIVEAADQGSGHLFVRTDDFRVAVQGTVFSVSHGTKGSRVSVIEGKVLVEQGGRDVALEPGQQYSSRQVLTAMPIEKEIAWSQNYDEHVSLMRELAALGRSIGEVTLSPELRYTSQLLTRVPEGTVIYGAVPNITERLGEAYAMFRQRLEQNDALRTWYEAESAGEGPSLEEVLDKVRLWGGGLGNEIVFVVARAENDPHKFMPMVLAEAVDSAGLRALAEAEAAKLTGDVNIQVIDDPNRISPTRQGLKEGGPQDLFVMIRPGIFALSPSIELLRNVDSGTELLASTRFARTIESSYANGVDWLVSVDLEAILGQAAGEQAVASHRDAALEQLGVGRVYDLVVERKREGDRTQARAVLTFDPTGQGVVSWIAAPGPIGALDFISQDAYLVAAFVIEEPRILVDEFLTKLGGSAPQAIEDLEQFEAEHGVNLREDIAAPLGGEFVFALDGPVLPTPSWKIVAEVNDPVKMQSTLEWFVQEVSRTAAAEGHPGLAMQSSGPYFGIGVAGSDARFWYTFTAGYLIAAPNTSLLDSTLKYQGAGYSLSGSATFVSVLPSDSNIYFSGFFYQNLAPLLQPLASGQLGATLDGLVPEGGPSLLQWVKDTPPMLVGLYREEDRITLAGTGDLETLWLNLGTLSALESPGGLVSGIEDAQ